MRITLRLKALLRMAPYFPAASVALLAALVLAPALSFAQAFVAARRGKSVTVGVPDNAWS